MTESYRSTPDLEVTPENPAVLAFESMFASQDFKDALVNAWNEPKESSVREAMVRGMVYVRHPYGMVYRFDNFTIPGKDKNIVEGRFFEDPDEFEALEAIRYNNSRVWWSDERERNDWKYDHKVGPEAEKRALRMAAIYFANSNEFTSLINQSGVMDVVSQNLEDPYKYEIGLIMKHEPNDSEKERLKRGVRGLDFNFYVFPKIDEQNGNYQQSLMMQKVIFRRARNAGIRIQTGINPTDKKGEFKVEYRLEEPLSPEQEEVFFDGINPKFLTYGGMPLSAIAH